MGKAVQLNPGHPGGGSRVGRKHEVTAIHKPTGISVVKDGISFQVTRKQALQDLEIRVAEQNES